VLSIAFFTVGLARQQAYWKTLQLYRSRHQREENMTICRDRRVERVLSFQPHWMEMFHWLLIKPGVPGVLCRICSTAHNQHLLTDGVTVCRQEDAFVSSGMNNWK